MVNPRGARFFQAATPEELHGAVTVRYEVFVLEQEVPVVLEVDARDFLPTTKHVVGYAPNDQGAETPVAAGRLLETPTESGRAFWIGRVAVSEDVRGTGLGKRIMGLLVDLARSELHEGESAPILLDAQVSATGFYLALGFEPTGDPVFIEAGIPHQRMTLTITSAP